MKFLIDAIRGFCMALADSVPGVSGGTIAFILGFYDKFINSLNDIVFGSKKEKRVALIFLLRLLIGWAIGLAIASLVLTSLFEKQTYNVSSVFIGFVIFSIPLIVIEEKKALKGKYKNLVFLLIGIIIVALITYFNPVSGGENAVDVSNLNFGLVLYIFFAAMIAISAMVLPGISGSTLLLIFGLYVPIMSAVKDLVHLNFKGLPILIIYVLGVITGILLIIKLIKLCLKKYRSPTIYLILGLMIGSIYAIIMGPVTLDVPQNPMSFETFNIFFFLLGGVIILGLEKLKNKLEKKIKENKIN